MSKDVETPIIGANFVINVLRTIPLVDNLFDQVLTFVQPKPNRPFVRLKPRITFDFELHPSHLPRPRHSQRPTFFR